MLAVETCLGADCPAVSGAQQATNDFALVQAGAAATIVYSSTDAMVVQIASGLFASDIQRVTGVLPVVTNSLSSVGSRIVLIGTIGHSSNLDSLIAGGKNQRRCHSGRVGTLPDSSRRKSVSRRVVRAGRRRWWNRCSSNT